MRDRAAMFGLAAFIAAEASAEQRTYANPTA
jgi:hypothetical protein